MVVEELVVVSVVVEEVVVVSVVVLRYICCIIIIILTSACNFQALFQGLGLGLIEDVVTELLGLLHKGGLQVSVGQLLHMSHFVSAGWPLKHKAPARREIVPQAATRQIVLLNLCTLTFL